MIRANTASVPINTNLLCDLASARTIESPEVLLVPGDLVEPGRLSAFQG